jgi:hypothetical protein
VKSGDIQPGKGISATAAPDIMVFGKLQWLYYFPVCPQTPPEKITNDQISMTSKRGVRMGIWGLEGMREMFF